MDSSYPISVNYPIYPILVLHLSEGILVFDTVSKILVRNDIRPLPHFHSALHVGKMQNNKKLISPPQHNPWLLILSTFS